MNNEDDCIENLMMKYGAKSVKQPSISQTSKSSKNAVGQSSVGQDGDNPSYEKIRSAYSDLSRRHNELVEYIAKMSKEQISDTYLECIKNDNVLLYQVNQDLRLIVKELCIKINDLKNETRKHQKTQQSVLDSELFTNGTQAKKTKDNNRILDMKNMEIDHLNQKIAELDNSKLQIENKNKELMSTQKFKNEANGDSDRLNKALKIANSTIDDLRNINRNLETMVQQKTNEINGYIERISNFQAQIADRETKFQFELNNSKTENGKLREEIDSFRKAVFDFQQRFKGGEKDTLEKQHRLIELERQNEDLRVFNTQQALEKQQLQNNNRELNGLVESLEQKIQSQEFSFSQRPPQNYASSNTLEIENLKSQNNNLNNKVRQHEDTFNQLQNSLNQNNDLINKVRQHEDTINQLQNNLKDTQIQLDSARKNALNKDKSISVTRSYSQAPIPRNTVTDPRVVRTSGEENTESNKMRLDGLLSRNDLDTNDKQTRQYGFAHNDVSNRIVETNENTPVNYSYDQHIAFPNLSSNRSENPFPIQIDSQRNNMQLASENSKLMTKVEYLQRSNQQYQTDIDQLKKEFQRRKEEGRSPSRSKVTDVFANEQIIEFNQTLNRMIYKHAEHSVQPLSQNYEYLIHELELAKTENERLKNQIQDMMQINSKNVEEIKRLTVQINELHTQMFQLRITKN